jgi:uncharacterized protein (DUF305 family)
MCGYSTRAKPVWSRRKCKYYFVQGTLRLLAAWALAGALLAGVRGGQSDAAKGPVVVQPGAPGTPSKVLPPSTRGTLPPQSQADVAFMQGMIMHHAQAVEMTGLIASHTENKDLRLLGARIRSSQSDEIKFMKRWLAARNEPISMAGKSRMDMAGPEKMDMETAGQRPSGTEGRAIAGAPGQAAPTMPWAMQTAMPGMLTAEQMEGLRQAKDAEFDKLFLKGMIQHHQGALTMVRDLFATAGAGQDADIFNFATDADNTQRAEIRIMESMLEKKRVGRNNDTSAQSCFAGDGSGGNDFDFWREPGAGAGTGTCATEGRAGACSRSWRSGSV